MTGPTQHARDAVRELKKHSARKDFVVRIRGGIYRLQETLVFSLEDSAPNGGTITYAAYPHEQPIPGSDVAIRSWRGLRENLPNLPAAARGKVRVADVLRELDSVFTLYDGSDDLATSAAETTATLASTAFATAEGAGATKSSINSYGNRHAGIRVIVGKNCEPPGCLRRRDLTEAFVRRIGAVVTAPAVTRGAIGRSSAIGRAAVGRAAVTGAVVTSFVVAVVVIAVVAAFVAAAITASAGTPFMAAAVMTAAVTAFVAPAVMAAAAVGASKAASANGGWNKCSEG